MSENAYLSKQYTSYVVDTIQNCLRILKLAECSLYTGKFQFLSLFVHLCMCHVSMCPSLSVHTCVPLACCLIVVHNIAVSCLCNSAEFFLHVCGAAPYFTVHWSGTNVH